MIFASLSDLRTGLANVRHFAGLKSTQTAGAPSGKILDSPAKVLLASQGFVQELCRFPVGREFLRNLAVLNEQRDSNGMLHQANVDVIKEQASFGSLEHLPGAAWLHKLDGLADNDPLLTRLAAQLNGAKGATLASSIVSAAERAFNSVEELIGANGGNVLRNLNALVGRCHEFENRESDSWFGWKLELQQNSTTGGTVELVVIDALNDLIRSLPDDPQRNAFDNRAKRLRASVRLLANLATKRKETWQKSNRIVVLPISEQEVHCARKAKSLAEALTLEISHPAEAESNGNEEEYVLLAKREHRRLLGENGRPVPSSTYQRKAGKGELGIHKQDIGSSGNTVRIQRSVYDQLRRREKELQAEAEK